MEWISVKDQEPPKDGSPFLCFDDEKEYEGKIYVIVFVKARKYPPGEFEKLSYDEHYREASGEGYFIWHPTHWMPLPNPPKDQ